MTAKRLTHLFSEFFNSEKAGGIALSVATVVALLLANSNFGSNFSDLWQINLGGHTLVQWVNDGLMAIFFLLIGLELEREIYKGELSNIRNATLPIFAALGGMIVPASIYFMFNIGQDSIAGAGIPMATDIAFAIGILSLLGSRVPISLKIFLTALAVIDDLGAILVIAIFYTKTISFVNLGISLSIFVLMLVLNRMKIHKLSIYIVGGLAMWYFMLNSGIHASIAGVLLAFAIPFADGKRRSPSYKLQHHLHKPVAFIILPIFAIANTGITLPNEWWNGLVEMSSIGIITGLAIGKPLGIVLFSLLAVKLGIASLADGIKWRNILGVGFLAGIGFTMSIFITLLAFDNEILIINSKIAILTASLLAGLIGYIILHLTLKQQKSRK